MQHERREHGTCSGLNALSHFNMADRATAVVKIPAAMEAPRAEQSLPADQIAALFLSANPQLPQGALTVSCNRDQLSEIRACLTKDLELRSCGRDVRSNCPPRATSGARLEILGAEAFIAALLLAGPEFL